MISTLYGYLLNYCIDYLIHSSIDYVYDGIYCDYNSWLF